MESASRKQIMTPFLKSAHSQIETALESLTTCDDREPHTSLFKAVRYALLSGGKRLRPLLTLAATHDLGGDLEVALLPSSALECIHTYSLIHDDLPCMDNDDMRRGKPSLHRAFDEGLAVLTGDFLLTKAFELITSAPGLTLRQKLRLVSSLSKRSGSEGMIGGQVVDIATKGKEILAKEQEWIDERKTASLFIVALEFGGVIAGASDDDLDRLRTIGHHFGLAFQLLDDLEDSHGPHPIRNELEKHVQTSLTSLESLSKPSLELKALLVNFYEHVQTDF